MSLTGIPLIKTAIFSCENPLILILESPKAPPALVAYTPGVEFNNSGSSRLPILSSISEEVNVETATGVSLSFAKATVPKTVTPESIFSPGLNSIVPKLAPSLTLTSTVSYPMYDMTRVEPASALIEKVPLKSVETPVEVPFTTTEAPGKPVPVSYTHLTLPTICSV